MLKPIDGAYGGDVFVTAAAALHTAGRHSVGSLRVWFDGVLRTKTRHTHDDSWMQDSWRVDARGLQYPPLIAALASAELVG